MKTSKCGSLVLLLVIAMSALSPTTAKAALTVKLTAGASSLTITDNASPDINGASNAISAFNVVVGDYNFFFTTSTTNSTGTPTLAFLNLGSITISHVGVPTTGTETVSLLATSTGFLSPTTPPSVDAISSATFLFESGTPSGNSADVSFESRINGVLVNADSAAGQFLGSPKVLMDGIGLSSLPNPFTMSFLLRADITGDNSILDANGQFQILANGHLPAVPEPASMAIWSLGAFGLAGFGIRRRKTTCV